MILHAMNHSDRIENLHPRFKQLFDYIKSNDLLNAKTGRIELDGDLLFINNVHPTLVKAEEQVMEAHHVYLDVHIPLDGAEIMGWKPTADCVEERQAYNAEKDVKLFYDKPEQYVTIYPGEFLIVYPEDAHAPLIGEGKIRKLVAKVKI